MAIEQGEGAPLYPGAATQEEKSQQIYEVFTQEQPDRLPTKADSPTHEASLELDRIIVAKEKPHE